MTGLEAQLVQQVFDRDWAGGGGRHVEALEGELCRALGVRSALAVSSGTAALHLALRVVGVGPGDEVLVSDLARLTTVLPIRHLGASPVFIDSERTSWNMDGALLAEALGRRLESGRLPRAAVVVHRLGQCANMGPILETCGRFGVTVVEDAGEALGATYKGKRAGMFGLAGVFSLERDRIVTASRGGILVSGNPALVEEARRLGTQGSPDVSVSFRDYEIGYDYEMSDILAAIGRGQLWALEDRIQARRRNFDSYREALEGVPGLGFMPEAGWGRSTRWLTAITVDAAEFGLDREDLRLALESDGIEARPLDPPLHSVFPGCDRIGGKVAEELFESVLCLPSGSGMTARERERVVARIRLVGESGWGGAGHRRGDALARPGGPRGRRPPARSPSALAPGKAAAAEDGEEP